VLIFKDILSCIISGLLHRIVAVSLLRLEGNRKAWTEIPEESWGGGDFTAFHLDFSWQV
jgi:hypothetical protein